jgi:transposase InsO family protein
MRLGPTQGDLRREWLTGLIGEIFFASRQTYGQRRVHAELVIGRGVNVNKKLVAHIMIENEWRGLPLHKARRAGGGPATAEDLVKRAFERCAPNQLWMTDITEHPTREGKVYCCAILDAHSRRVVGWAIDSVQDAALVSHALGMAVAKRKPKPGCIVHSDHGTQFTSWHFSERIRQAGCMPSMGRVGSAHDNAMIESFWGRMQTELLNRRKWRTRVELASAIQEYLEVFYNRQRRHSSLGMLTPIEYENTRKDVA